METVEYDHQALREVIRRFLPEIRKHLGKSIRQREDVFLHLGGRLQEFTLRAGTLAKNSQELLSDATGQAMGEIIDVFHKELEAISNVCSTQTADAAIRELGNIISLIENLEKLMQEFGRLVRHLQMLGISTRIESARLGSEGRGFHTLADDVEKLANRIVSHTSSILENARSLAELSRLASKQTESMRSKQATCSVRVFSEINSNLDELQSLTQSAHELSEHLINMARDTRDNIGEAVSSLQFHDIIRQQVEHVEEACDDIEALVSGKSSQNNDAPTDSNELVGWVADVLNLQCRQVSNGRERFVNAVENLKRNLGNIGGNVNAMEIEITKLLGEDAGSGARTLERIEKGIGGMLETMKEFASQGEAIGRTMSSVADTVSQIGAFLGDIEEVGAEIELIALNASIKAAHTGEQGKAMGVLASSVQHLSKEATGQTDGVAGLLKDISKAADSLAERADSFLDTSQVNDMLARLRKVVTNLKNIDQEFATGFVNLQHDSSQLGLDINSLTKGITFHLEAGRHLDVAETKLSSMEEETRVLAPEEDETRRSERLRQLLERYTMEAERLVHEGMATEPGDARDGEETASDAGDDWNNVELF